MNDLTGLRIIESPHLTVPRTVTRTWRERLFSWPWRPWRATRVVQAPDPSMYQMAGGLLVGHPVTINRLRRAAEELSP